MQSNDLSAFDMITFLPGIKRFRKLPNIPDYEQTIQGIIPRFNWIQQDRKLSHSVCLQHFGHLYFSAVSVS